VTATARFKRQRLPDSKVCDVRLPLPRRLFSIKQQAWCHPVAHPSLIRSLRPLPSTCALKSLLRHLLVNSAELRATVTAAAGSSGAARATRRVVPTIDIETSFWTRWLRWRHAEGIGSSRARLVAHLVHQCLWLVFQCLQLFISQHVSVFSLLASSAN
jgi:hypothetical protein